MLGAGAIRLKNCSQSLAIVQSWEKMRGIATLERAYGHAFSGQCRLLVRIRSSPDTDTASDCEVLAVNGLQMHYCQDTPVSSAGSLIKPPEQYAANSVTRRIQ